MKDYRTEFEKRVHESVVDLMHLLGGGQLHRFDYPKAMGLLRDLKTALVNKQFGCATGRHAGACHCQIS